MMPYSANQLPRWMWDVMVWPLPSGFCCVCLRGTPGMRTEKPPPGGAYSFQLLGLASGT
jgi:hypothetical protein